MFGKNSFKKIGNWIGKTGHTVVKNGLKVNNWIGKTLDKGGALYENGKEALTEAAHHLGIGQEVGSIIGKIEHSPLGASIAGLYDTVKDVSKDASIIGGRFEKELRKYGKKKRSDQAGEDSNNRQFRLT